MTTEELTIEQQRAVLNIAHLAIWETEDEEALAEIPKGSPGYGIAKATLEKSQRDRRNAVAAYRKLGDGA